MPKLFVIPDIFRALCPQEPTSAEDPSAFYLSALRRAIQQAPVSDALLLEIALTLFKERNAYLTAHQYIILALFVPELYTFLKTHATMTKKTTAASISQQIVGKQSSMITSST